MQEALARKLESQKGTPNMEKYGYHVRANAMLLQFAYFYTQGFSPPQVLAEQLTLSQPGGQIMPTTVIQAPLDFQTLRRP